MRAQRSGGDIVPDPQGAAQGDVPERDRLAPWCGLVGFDTASLVNHRVGLGTIPVLFRDETTPL